MKHTILLLLLLFGCKKEDSITNTAEPKETVTFESLGTKDSAVAGQRYSYIKYAVSNNSSKIIVDSIKINIKYPFKFRIGNTFYDTLLVIRFDKVQPKEVNYIEFPNSYLKVDFQYW